MYSAQQRSQQTYYQNQKLMQQILDKANKVDFGCQCDIQDEIQNLHKYNQTSNEKSSIWDQIYGTTTDSTKKHTMSTGKVSRGYMKLQNRKPMRKKTCQVEHHNQKKTTMIDRFRKQELPVDEKERK